MILCGEETGCELQDLPSFFFGDGRRIIPRTGKSIGETCQGLYNVIGCSGAVSPQSQTISCFQEENSWGSLNLILNF